MPAGLVAFSFARRDESEEPNPSNKQLAKAVEKLIDKDKALVVVAQWEIARQLKKDGYKPALDVGPEFAGNDKYLESDEVWEQAEKLFKRQGITDVIVVAQPFLHLSVVSGLVKSRGFNVIKTKIGPITFDNSPKNKQWWTKGKLRFITYAILVKLTGKHGIGEKD